MLEELCDFVLIKVKANFFSCLGLGFFFGTIVGSVSGTIGGFLSLWFGSSSFLILFLFSFVDVHDYVIFLYLWLLLRLFNLLDLLDRLYHLNDLFLAIFILLPLLFLLDLLHLLH